MTEPAGLDEFDFRHSHYERPSRGWMCGSAAAGLECPLGPDRRGRCRAGPSCVPRHDGERWSCTRPESRGGPCGEGPRPDGSCSVQVPRCVPVRGVASRRRLVTRWAMAVVAAFLAVALAAGGQAWLVNPGPLSAGHGDVSQCAACHTSYDGGVSAWLHAAATGEGAGVPDGSCIACHDLGPSAKLPHGISAEEMKPLHASAQQEFVFSWHHPVVSSMAWLVRAGPDTPPLVLGCADCHEEHEGSEFDLRRIGDDECQACHLSRFPAFTMGHPKFTDYPYDRRTRIDFDHLGHFERHFDDSDAPKTCLACHALNPNSGGMGVHDFQEICESCHEADIVGKDDGRGVGTALPLISIPRLDIATLAARGIGIGGWPADAGGGLDALTRMILASEPDTAAALDLLGDRSLEDLADASDAELAAVGETAWAFKTLMMGMRVTGGDAIRERLSSVASADALTKLDELAGEFRAALLHPAIDGWFPDLAGDMALHEVGGMAVTTVAGTASDDPDDLGPLLPGWAAREGDADDLGPLLEMAAAVGTAGADLTVPAVQGVIAADFAIRYRPLRHGDRVMRGLFDFAALESTKRGDALLGQLGRRGMDGQCAKCHTIDREQSGDGAAAGHRDASAGVVVNWHPEDIVGQPHGFTFFSHRPHVALSGGLACLSCHQLNPVAQAATATTPADAMDPHIFQSAFTSISKSFCAGCHNGTSVTESCTTCHNYHTAETRPVVRNAPIRNAIPSRIE